MNIGKKLRYAATVALLAGFMAGCSANAPPETFPKPDYSYLPPLNLNVADITVTDDAPAPPNSLDAKAPPLPPDQNLALMAHERLHATGASGQGVLTITQADITQGPGEDMLSGTYSVTLTLDDPATHHRGEITARVTHKAQTADDSSKARNLYALNQALMDDMNVELEYQIRKNLSSWLTDATGTPLSGAVKSQNLGMPGATALPPLNGSQASRSAISAAQQGAASSARAVDNDNATDAASAVSPVSVPKTGVSSDLPNAAMPLAPPLSSASPEGAGSSERIHSPPPNTLHLPN